MKKALKILLYVISSILILLILIVIFLQFPWGKNLVREKIVSFLSDKLKTEVIIQDLDYHIPNSIGLNGVAFLDQKKDTLLALQQLKLDIDMLALIGKKIKVNGLLIDGLNAHVYRNADDSLFNYNYIISAFAGVDTTQKIEKVDTSSSSLTFDVVKVELKNIRLKYDDTAGGTLFFVNLNNLVIRPKTINIDKSIYAVKDLIVDGLQTNFVIDTSYLKEVIDTAKAADFKIAVDNIDLKKVNFRMLNRTDSMYMNYEIGHLQAEIKQFGLLDQFVEVGDLTLENTVSAIIMGKSKNNIPEPETTDSSTNNWRVIANSIAVNKVDFLLDNNNQPRIKSGIDYAHLKIKNFFFNAQDILYSTDTISADLKHLTLTEQSGLNIQELRSKILYYNQGAQLNQLYLLTPNTLLQDRLILSYPSIASLSNNMGKMRMDINFDKSKVGINDVLYFMSPEQQKQLLPYKNQSFALTAKLSGLFNSLLIDRLYVAGLNGTVIDVNGKLNGLPNSKDLHYDLDLKQVRTVYKDIAAFIPDSVKQQVRIPELMSINGKISGGLMQYFPDVSIHTSDGNATVKGEYSMVGGEHKEKYDLAITTTTLDLGKILRQPDSVLGKVTVVANVKGMAFDPKFMDANYDVKVIAADALKYNYNNIQLSGVVQQQRATFKGNSTDPNLDFSIDGNANLGNEYPSLFANLNMRNVDLFALHFMSDTMQLKGDILADFASLNPDYPAGNFSWVKGHLTMPGINLPLDSIILKSHPVDSSQNLYLNASKLLYTSITGHIPLTKIGDAMLAHVNKHYKLGDSVVEKLNSYDMNLATNIIYSPLINRWMPDLRPFDTIKIKSGLSPDTFGLFAFIPRLVKGTNILDSTYVRIRENPDTFGYNIGLKRFTSGSLELNYPALRGLIKNDSIYALVTIKDTASKYQFAFGGSMTQNRANDSGITYIRLFKGLRFDYEKWNVNPNNVVVLSPEGYYIKNLDISNGDQSISVHSVDEIPQSPFSILIKNFELANITKMFSKDTLVAEGKLNLDANLDLRDSFPKIDATATVSNLKAFQTEIGTLDLNAKNETESAFDILLKLNGNDNDITLKGNYYLQPVNNNDFDLNLNIVNLSLKSMQGLAFGAIKNSSGDLTGNLDFKGTIDQPDLTGSLKTKNLLTTVQMLNAPFLIPSETIQFNHKVISFDNFKIEDLNKRSATIDGNIKTTDFKSYLLNLHFDAKRWQPINSFKIDNPEFYGKLIMSADLDIQGNATAPKIDGSLTIHDSTDFTYAMLDNGPGYVAHEGIVKFVDNRDTFFVDPVFSTSSSIGMPLEAAQMNVNINIDKKAKFQVLIDPASGDMLQVMGDAQLNTFIAPDGSIGITGVYDLDGGYYELNYKFLRRKFDIEKGSTITLAGDPLDADASITAVYNAMIAPYSLLESQVSTDQLVYYKQRLPFQVLLKISGKVLKPEISFDIVLPEEKANIVSSDVANLVQAKLAELRLNPSELNKQVFAALVLGRFISNDPFSSPSGGVEYAVRQSVSKFLSEQLSQLSAGLIPGLELNVGLNSSEDYSTGAKQDRTGLDVSASKRFFSDRLKVTVGNNFELEGQASQQQKTSLIPGDLSIDYQLTKDGRYSLRAYRTNQLQNLVDGYTVETGLSFRLSMEYNKFRSLFINNQKYRAKKRAKRKKERQMEKIEEEQDSAKLQEEVSFIQKQKSSNK